MTSKKGEGRAPGQERVDRAGGALGWEHPREEAAEGKELWAEAEKSPAARSGGTDIHGQPGVERTVYAVLY